MRQVRHQRGNGQAELCPDYCDVAIVQQQLQQRAAEAVGCPSWQLLKVSLYLWVQDCASGSGVVGNLLNCILGMLLHGE